MPHTYVGTGAGKKFPASTQCEDYTLLDPLEQEIGRVEEVFVDGRGDPEYVKVAVKKGFLQSRTLLIPISFAETDDGRRTLTLK